MINISVPNIEPPEPDDKANQESISFANGKYDEMAGTEANTHKFIHKWCIRVLLGVGTLAVLSFAIFLMYILAYLIWVYVEYITGIRPDNLGAKANIETLLGHIWKIASGSSFLVVFAQVILIGIRKNLKF